MSCYDNATELHRNIEDPSPKTPISGSCCTCLHVHSWATKLLTPTPPCFPGRALHLPCAINRREVIDSSLRFVENLHPADRCRRVCSDTIRWKCRKGKTAGIKDLLQYWIVSNICFNIGLSPPSYIPTECIPVSKTLRWWRRVVLLLRDEGGLRTEP